MSHAGIDRHICIQPSDSHPARQSHDKFRKVSRQWLENVIGRNVMSSCVCDTVINSFVNNSQFLCSVLQNPAALSKN